MKLRKTDVGRIAVIDGTSQDERQIVLELQGERDGVLIQDNAGWSITVDNPFDDVVKKLRGEDTEDEVELHLVSTTVSGIQVVEHPEFGWVVKTHLDSQDPLVLALADCVSAMEIVCEDQLHPSERNAFTNALIGARNALWERA